MDSSSGSSDSIEGLLNESNSDYVLASSLVSMSNLINFSTNFSSPPSLEFLAGNETKLKDIAKELHTLFTQKGKICFTENDLIELEKIFSIFSNELMKSTINEQQKLYETEQETKSPNKSESNTNPKENSDSIISSLKEQLEKQQDLIKTLTEDNRDLQEALQNEKEDHRNTVSKFSQIKQEKESQETDLKRKIDAIEQELKASQDRNKQDQYALKRVNEKCDDLTSINSNLELEISSLRSKIQTKNSKIHEMKDLIQQCGVQHESDQAERDKFLVVLNDYKSKYSTLQTKYKQLLANANNSIMQSRNIPGSTMMDPNEMISGSFEDTIEKNKEAMEEVIEAMDRQHKELSKEFKMNRTLISYITKMNQMLTKYEEILADKEKEVDKYKSENLEISKNAIQYQKQSVSLEDENKELREKSKNYEIYQEIKEIIEIDDDKEVLNTISKLVGAANNNEELVNMNSRLISLIQSHMSTVFDIMKGLPEKGKVADARAILKQIDPSFVFSGNIKKKQNDLLNEIKIERSRCNAFLAENDMTGGTSPQQSSEEIINSLSSDNSIASQEVICLLQAQVEKTTILRTICEELKEEMQTINNQMQKIADGIGFEGNTGDLSSEIIDKFNEVDIMTSKILNAIQNDDDDSSKQDLNQTEKFSYILESVIEMKRILSLFDKSVRKSVNNYTVALDALPRFVVQYIEDLKEKQKQDNSTTQNSQEQFDEMITETYKKDIEELREKLHKLENDKGELEIQNLTLQQQIQKYEEQTRTNDLQTTMLNDFKQNTDEKIQNLELENSRLQQQIKENMDEYSQAIDQLNDQFDKEKEDYRIRLEEKVQIQIKKYQNAIISKSNKLEQAKKKLKDVVQTYEQALQDQRETAQQIKQQNDKLTNQITALNQQLSSAKTMDSSEVKRLTTVMKSLRAQNKLLEVKVKQLEEQKSTIKDVTDEYWKSQVKKEVQKATKEVQEQIQNEKEKHDKFVRDINTLLEPETNDQNQNLASPTQQQTTKTLKDHSDQESSMSSIISINEEDTIISNLISMKTRLDSFQKSQTLSRSTRDASRTSSLGNDKNSKPSKALREWERWARNMFVSVCDVPVPGKSSEEIRYLLTEMITASSNQIDSIRKLEILRTQKKILLSLLGDFCIPINENETSIRSLLLISVFIRRLRKNIF